MGSGKKLSKRKKRVDAVCPEHIKNRQKIKHKDFRKRLK